MDVALKAGGTKAVQAVSHDMQLWLWHILQADDAGLCRRLILCQVHEISDAASLWQGQYQCDECHSMQM